MAVLALVDDTPVSRVVLAAAVAAAGLLDGTATAVHAGPTDGTAERAAAAAGLTFRLLAGDPATALSYAVNAPGIRLGVLGARRRADDPRPVGGTAAELLARSDTPLLVVGPRCRVPVEHGFRRVLAPLDGTTESARGVRDVVDRFASSGLDVVVVHVFTPDTVPAFFDQPQHAYPEFTSDFLGRNVGPESARLALESGECGPAVVRVAEAEHADLVALAWSRTLAPGRADVIRHLLAYSRIPLLLMPAGTDAVAQHPTYQGSGSRHGR